MKYDPPPKKVRFSWLGYRGRIWHAWRSFLHRKGIIISPSLMYLEMGEESMRRAKEYWDKFAEDAARRVPEHNFNEPEETNGNKTDT